MRDTRCAGRFERTQSVLSVADAATKDTAKGDLKKENSRLWLRTAAETVATENLVSDAAASGCADIAGTLFDNRS